jgi:phage-related protein
VSSLGGTKAETIATLERTADDITREIREATSVTVDARTFKNDPAAIYSYPVVTFLSVQDLLNEVYFRLEPLVRPYEYGKAWILKNSKTGTVYKALAAGVNQAGDQRSLSDLGITGGTQLQVARVPGK